MFTMELIKRNRIKNTKVAVIILVELMFVSFVLLVVACEPTPNTGLSTEAPIDSTEAPTAFAATEQSQIPASTTGLISPLACETVVVPVINNKSNQELTILVITVSKGNSDQVNNYGVVSAKSAKKLSGITLLNQTALYRFVAKDQSDKIVFSHEYTTPDFEETNFTFTIPSLEPFQMPILKRPPTDDFIKITAPFTLGEPPKSPQPGQTIGDATYIPYGSIIYHWANGIVEVFDSDGNRILIAKDSETPIRIGPGNSHGPVTSFFSIPDGASIEREGESDFKVYLYSVLIGVKIISQENYQRQ